MIKGNCVSFTPHQIDLMRKAGRLTAMARAYAGTLIQPGITTRDIDHEIEKFIKKNGGYPSFYHLYGFKGSACISINDEIIHGVPGSYKLKEGDIVSVDVGACIGDYRLDRNKSASGGYHGDCCATFACGEISPEAKRLIEVTEQSFWKGFEQCVVGKRVHDISRAVQTHVESNGYSLVREYTGHGIGREMHEDPSVPNFGKAGTGMRLRAGTVLCVEPMIAIGSWRVKILDDEWTAVTTDGKPAAHYENTLVVREDGVEILTL